MQAIWSAIFQTYDSSILMPIAVHSNLEALKTIVEGWLDTPLRVMYREGEMKGDVQEGFYVALSDEKDKYYGAVWLFQHNITITDQLGNR